MLNPSLSKWVQTSQKDELTSVAANEELLPVVDVTILMPCLNEVKALPYCLERAQQALQSIYLELGLTGEILISDNGSNDGSQALASASGARVVHCSHKGYGNVLRYGMAMARGRYIIFGDSDGSYDFLESTAIVSDLTTGSDVCMGSRFSGEIEEGSMPWKNRYIGNPILTGVLNLFFRTPISDAHCGLRGLTKDAFEQINPVTNGMEFASELVIKAQMLNLTQTEVPVTLSKDKRGRPPHLRPWRDGWRHLRYLMMLSPTWLYFFPGLLMTAIGVLLFSVLLLDSNSTETSVSIIGFKFGDHWSIIAGGLISIGHLSVLFGCSIIVLGVGAGYRRMADYPSVLSKLLKLEYMILTGCFFCLLAVVMLAYVIVSWGENDFGTLSMIREMVAANTFLLVGIQTIFSGFMLSALSENTTMFTPDGYS